MENKFFTKNIIYKLIGIAIIGVIFLILLIKLYPFLSPLITEFKDDPQAAMNKIKDYVNSFGALGFAVFIFFEIIQVIIALIPGDFFHVSAGFIYGMPKGFLIAYIGELIGALIAFSLAKYFGTDIVKKFVPEDKIIKTKDLINSAKGTFGILILCLIPFIPKDILIYVAGITPVNPARFLTVFLLCRIPDIFIKASGAAALSNMDWTTLIIVVAAFLLFVGGGLYLKKKFIKTEE
ncbi:MAG: TVP38/TMEM64 family protein [Clostridiaceae bacterium]|jgi:uncharacterized membrane protein YdjX (TVP38/TMEM64 family)|nr:TVP38/TMEM64 family protein [Clostridiaceae bacterium]